MSIREIEIDANRKWLAAHGVTDWATWRKAKRKAAKAALRKLDELFSAFDDYEMLDDLTPDGEHSRLSPHLVDEARRIRAKLNTVQAYLKRGMDLF